MPAEYETFDWNGQTRYRCMKSWESGDPCEYDTYDVDQLRRHVAEPHNRTGVAKGSKVVRTVSPIADAGGNQIVHEHELPDEFVDMKFKP